MKNWLWKSHLLATDYEFYVSADDCVSRVALRDFVGDAVRSLHYQLQTQIIWVLAQSYGTSNIGAQVQIHAIDPRSGIVVAGTTLSGVMNGYSSAYDTQLELLYFFAQDCDGVQWLASINLTSISECEASNKGKENS